MRVYIACYVLVNIGPTVLHCSSISPHWKPTCCRDLHCCFSQLPAPLYSMLSTLVTFDCCVAMPESGLQVWGQGMQEYNLYFSQNWQQRGKKCWIFSGKKKISVNLIKVYMQFATSKRGFSGTLPFRMSDRERVSYCIMTCKFFYFLCIFINSGDSGIQVIKGLNSLIHFNDPVPTPEWDA